ncbi:hypothetical protein MTR_7g060800 [Medicago truncatula]|uniref:FAR1 DNA-binding domain protein n=1 Tax=Medicago truncatula TaxID=3880 RepID=G7L4F7_MEDTR|nr:hypothetical protein MTR_7g060800 [Medicago truncatula]
MENNLEENMQMDESVASVEGLKSLSARVSVEVTCEIVNDDAASIEAREGSEEVYCLDTAYEFYNRYARMNGFAVRNSKIIKINKGEILQQPLSFTKKGLWRTVV